MKSLPQIGYEITMYWQFRNSNGNDDSSSDMTDISSPSMIALIVSLVGFAAIAGFVVTIVYLVRDYKRKKMQGKSETIKGQPAQLSQQDDESQLNDFFTKTPISEKKRRESKIALKHAITILKGDTQLGVSPRVDVEDIDGENHDFRSGS